jgi:cell division protein FtsB
MADAGEDSPHALTRSPGRRLPRTRQEIQDRRRRLLTYAVLISSAVLMVDALVGQNGYLANLRAHREIAALSADVDRLQGENLLLAEEADRLKHDPNAIEEAARRDLGLMKPGEVVVVVQDAPSPAASGSDDR